MIQTEATGEDSVEKSGTGPQVRRAYMCSTDFDSELEFGSDGRVYQTLSRLKARAGCVTAGANEPCAIYEVEIRLIGIVEPTAVPNDDRSNEPKRSDSE